MNVEYLRQSLKVKWLGYYRENRPWLVRLGVWVNVDGQRRPSSSFILATLSILEPQLTDMLPLVVDLSSNPDRIVAALGLNFSPDQELEALSKAEHNGSDPVKMLPSSAREVALNKPPSRLPTSIDETCEGIRRDDSMRSRP